MYSGSILQDTIEFNLYAEQITEGNLNETYSSLRVELIKRAKEEQIKLGNMMGAEYRIHRLQFDEVSDDTKVMMTVFVTFACVVGKYNSAISDNLVIPFNNEGR